MSYVERKSRVNSTSPFSFKSMTINLEGLNGNKALIKDEPIEPAPPITHTLLFSISA